MSETAFQTMYRQEFVAAFEQQVSLLRDCTTTEAQIKGNTAVFLVAGSGGATAVTRGVNGLIPARNDDLDQFSCVLGEWHDLVRKTKFNIFASQGNQREIMQKTTMGVINRKIDEQIITELNTGTVSVGAASAVPQGRRTRQARRNLPGAARNLRRRRHDSRLAGNGRCALRRLRRAGFRRRNGQSRDEAPVPRSRSAHC